LPTDAKNFSKGIKKFLIEKIENKSVEPISMRASI